MSTESPQSWWQAKTVATNFQIVHLLILGILNKDYKWFWYGKPLNRIIQVFFSLKSEITLTELAGKNILSH